MPSQDLKKRLQKLANFEKKKELATFVELVQTHDKVDDIIKALKELQNIKLSSEENKELLENILEEAKKKEFQIEIDDELKEELRGKDGEDGDDGKDAEITPELIKEISNIVLSKIPKIKDGEDGVDGEDYILTEEDKEEIIKEIQSKIVIPEPKEVDIKPLEEKVEKFTDEQLERIDKRLRSLRKPQVMQGGSSGLHKVLADGVTLKQGATEINFVGFTTETTANGITVTDLGSNEFYKEQIGVAGSNYPSFTGTLDGVNKVFTVAQGEYITGSLHVELNGKGDANGSAGGWSETDATAGTFTFETAPESGDYIFIEYQVASTTSGNADTVDGYHASAFELVRTMQVKAVSYTLLTTDRGVLASGTVTITLPTAVSDSNWYKVTNTGTGVVTVDTTNSETINGSTSIELEAQQSRVFDSNNANWFIG